MLQTAAKEEEEKEMRLSDLCSSPSNPLSVGKVFWKQILPLLIESGMEFSAQTHISDVHFHTQFGSRRLYRAGEWMIKVDASLGRKERWSHRESEAMEIAKDVPGVVCSRLVLVDPHKKIHLNIGPWRDIRPPSVDSTPTISMIYEMLGDLGIMIRDCLWPVITESERCGVSVLDLGCFRIATPDEARKTNGFRLVEIAKKQVEMKHANC